MTKGLAIGLVIAMMGIIGGMAIVHHHEDEDRERAIFQLQRDQSGIHMEVNPQRQIIERPIIEPQRDYYRPRNCDLQKLLRLHNAVHIGFQGFHLDRNLTQAAHDHAEQMARNNRLMPYSGESNIACGPMSEYAVFQYWMTRTTSRYNIIEGHHHNVGFGSAYGRDGKIYWCAIYR